MYEWAEEKKTIESWFFLYLSSLYQCFNCLFLVSVIVVVSMMNSHQCFVWRYLSSLQADKINDTFLSIRIYKRATVIVATA